MNRDEKVGYYQAVANAIYKAEIDMTSKIEVVKQLCISLKDYDERFSPEKFSVACWGENW